MARYLVTGGAGFIGSRMVRRLLERGDTAVVLDDLSTGFRENVPPGAEFVQGDLADPAVWEGLSPEGVDAVLHLGAQSSGEVSHEDPLRDFDVNARGSLLLLGWCERHGVRRLLHASSMAVYGNSDRPSAEDAPKRPGSFYGASKLAAEGYITLFARRGGAPTVFRLFNVYGPGQNLGNLKQGMVSIYMAYLLDGEPVLVKGSLDRFRDFVYVDDVVDAWMAALARPETAGETYNLASGRRTTVRELLDGLLAAFGRAGEDRVVQGEGTAGDIAGSVADISKIRRELEWSPKTELREGLGRMVRWARERRGASAREDV
ncbi:MAG: NAD-dependent epimerase/dehydratase family protein [bacterium]